MLRYNRLFLLVFLWISIVLPRSSCHVASDHSEANSYAPLVTTCPRKPLVRAAKGLNEQESEYVSSREVVAGKSLLAWVKKVWGDSPSIEPRKTPRLAVALSGGGSKAALIAAGAVYGLDSRDSNIGVSGLLQSMTYISALSGGSLTLSGVMANNFSRISTLKKELYNKNYQDPITPALGHAKQIGKQVTAKSLAGYPASIIDLYGRLLGYDFIGGVDGASGTLWSDVVKQSAFHESKAPYPIITSTNADVSNGQCTPNATGAIWEFSPYEFGSWNPGVQAFMRTKYVGTSTFNRSSTTRGKCTVGFDNLGFFTGMSANDLSPTSKQCSSVSRNGTQTKLSPLASVLYKDLPATDLRSAYGIIPNPFRGYAPSYSVSSQHDLYMVDGGFTFQGIPLMPFLQPERKVDVIFAIDSESQTARNITNGGSIYNTFKAAKRLGLSRMPKIPDLKVIKKQNLTSRAQFFGCYNPKVATLIYIPDSNETEISADADFLTPKQINQVFDGAIDMVSQSKNAEWPACVACGIMQKRMPSLPKICKKCLNKYCWN